MGGACNFIRRKRTRLQPLNLFYLETGFLHALRQTRPRESPQVPRHSVDRAKRRSSCEPSLRLDHLLQQALNVRRCEHPPSPGLLDTKYFSEFAQGVRNMFDDVLNAHNGESFRRELCGFQAPVEYLESLRLAHMHARIFIRLDSCALEEAFPCVTEKQAAEAPNVQQSSFLHAALRKIIEEPGVFRHLPGRAKLLSLRQRVRPLRNQLTAGIQTHHLFFRWAVDSEQHAAALALVDAQLALPPNRPRPAGFTNQAAHKLLCARPISRANVEAGKHLANGRPCSAIQFFAERLSNQHCGWIVSPKSCPAKPQTASRQRKERYSRSWARAVRTASEGIGCAEPTICRVRARPRFAYQRRRR